MPRGKLRPTFEEVKSLLAEDHDFVRPLVQAVLQELLEAEMTEALGAEKGERSAARLGYRSPQAPTTATMTHFAEDSGHNCGVIDALAAQAHDALRFVCVAPRASRSGKSAPCGRRDQGHAPHREFAPAGASDESMETSRGLNF